MTFIVLIMIQYLFTHIYMFRNNKQRYTRMLSLSLVSISRLSGLIYAGQTVEGPLVASEARVGAAIPGISSKRKVKY